MGVPRGRGSDRVELCTTPHRSYQVEVAASGGSNARPCNVVCSQEEITGGYKGIAQCRLRSYAEYSGGKPGVAMISR
jgi:hypothetical protein